MSASPPCKLRVKSIRRSRINQQFYNAASEIARHNPNFVQSPEHDYWPMDDLLKKCANFLLDWSDKVAPAGQDQREKTPAVIPDQERHRIRILERRIADIEHFAHKKLYAYRHDSVPDCWICMYTNVLILHAYYHLLQMIGSNVVGEEANEERLQKHINLLDMAMIHTNVRTLAINGLKWATDIMDEWETLVQQEDQRNQARIGTDSRRHLFSDDEPFERPVVRFPVPRKRIMNAIQLEDYMLSDEDHDRGPLPALIPGVLDGWPAMDERAWRDKDYLLSRTLGGRRQVPIEIGRSYVDHDWGQEVISFGKFVDKYVVKGESEPDAGYLAQHNLFRHIPKLRNDILVPDLCAAATTTHPTNDTAHLAEHEDGPSLNAWFGPARTITPLHHDAYHNLLCQVVGTKYVRLYSPHSMKIKPRTDEYGVDMSNTSSLDVGVLAGFDEPPLDMTEEEVEAQRLEMEDEEYFECILNPGDTLYIPIGWWHYVRSLSISFSVSFWWNRIELH